MNILRFGLSCTTLATLMAAQQPAAQPAAAAAPPPRLTAVYQDGRAATVELLELRDDRVRLRSQLYGGSVAYVARLEQFTPMTRYRMVLAAGQPSSYEEHFAMAQRTGSWRMLEQTAMHLRSALAAAQGADDEADKQAAARSWAANWLEEIVGEALAEGDVREAERRLELLSTRLADRCSEERLEQLAVQIDELRNHQESEQRKTRQAKLADRERNEIEGRLQPILAQVEAGDKRMRDAMRNSRRTVQTTRLASSALDAYRSAWAEAQVLLKRHPDHEELASELAALAMSLQERSVRAALHAANAQTMQSDFRSAMTWVERALELDPDNKDARELRSTIHVASAAAGGWGWGWLPLREPARAR